MNISAPFILRPVMTTLLTIAALVIGLTAFYQLPVSNLPDVNYPTITVTIPFPGTNPEIMANTVATPLEKEFMTIPGIHYVISSNTLGQSSIVLQFDISKDIDLAAVDVQSAITRARPNLPPDLPQEPSFRKVNPSSTPVLYITVTSPTMPTGELYDYANTLIGQQISTIDGVAQVLVYGSRRAVRAQVDPGLIAYLNLAMQDLSTNINSGNQYQPLGQFDGDHTALTIYDTGGLYTAQEYDPLIIAYKDGAPIRMDQLGVVVDSLSDDRSVRRYVDQHIDQPSVTLAVLRQPGANAVNVSTAVKELLANLEGQLPGSVQLKMFFDRSESVKESVKDVELTLIVAFILVVLVIYLYLGKARDTIIPSIAMPLSIIFTFAFMYLFGYTLDTLSLLALTLAVGFIIDDAIVVLENIVRKIEEGKSPLEASLDGSKQIGFTILSMTISLIAVFIPLLFMAGLVGKLFQEFAVTLTVVTLLSGIISLTLTPMLCSRFLPPRDAIHSGKVGNLSIRFNAWSSHYYEKALKWVLRHRPLILMIGLASIGASILLFRILPTDFIPDDDIGFVSIFTEAAQGTSSDQMNQYQRQLIDILKKQPYIESFISISANPQYRQGILFARLIAPENRKSAGEIIQDLNQILNHVPGVNVYIKNIPLIDLNVGPQVRGNYQYMIQSLNSEELYTSAQELLNKMRRDPTFQGITTDLEVKTPQVKLVIDRDQASALGITAEDFEKTLSLSLSGNRISRIQTPLDQYDVILEMGRDYQRNPSSLSYMYVRSDDTKQLVPIEAVSQLVEQVGPASINHFSQFPAVTITFNIDPDIPLSEGIKRLRELADETFPKSVTGSMKGAAESFEESIRSIGFLVIVTIITIYIVLGILYESFIHPITILSTLPPAILGALLTLYITGRPLSLYAYLGIILLIGIVKKNGIMIVDFALDNIRSKKEDAETSIIEASLVRFRPIMMTTIAAIMGALPIALGIGAGAASRRPLGLVIIGGMLVSQLITLFLTPVIYLYLEQLREKYTSKY